MAGLRSERRETPAGRVLLLTLDRPEVLNAINSEVLAALEQVTRDATPGDLGGQTGNDPRGAAANQAGDDPAGEGVRAIVITGAGERAFSAGADITTFSALNAVGAEELMHRGQRVFQALEDLPMPVIAAINGYALGGGLELALACDLRFASATAKMGQPEATLANLPGWGGTQRLPRAVGEARAKDLIFSGRLVDAAEAERIGLVQAVYEPGELVERALAYAARLLPAGRTALGFAKQAIHAARAGGEAGYAVERQGVALCFTTEEQHEAVRRFVHKEKRR